MKKIIACALLGAFLLVLTAGCKDNTLSAALKDKGVTDLMDGVKAQPLAAAAAMDNSFQTAAQQFAVDLFNKSAVKDQNTLVSPLSALVALGMTANGAAGDTKAAFDKLLGTADYNPSFRVLFDVLAKHDKAVTLTLADSVWCDDGMTVRDQFLQTTADVFAAEAYKCDLHAPDTLDAVNTWIDSKTGGKIKKLVDSGDMKEAVMLLINALYFKAPWQNEFNPDATADAAFHADGGDVSVPMMHSKQTWDDIAYYQGDGFSSVLLPYKGSDNLVFMALLPDGDLPSFAFTPAVLADIVGHANTKVPCSVTMPKFNVDVKMNLSETLKSMGLAVAFDDKLADFSGMSPDGLYIGKVLQGCGITVNESGTEAAAATVVMMYKGMAANYITFDRPFIYGILDLSTGIPLFLGSYNGPQA